MRKRRGRTMHYTLARRVNAWRLLQRHARTGTHREAAENDCCQCYVFECVRDDFFGGDALRC